MMRCGKMLLRSHRSPAKNFPLQIPRCIARRAVRTYAAGDQYSVGVLLESLEAYTDIVKAEVLLVKALLDGEEDEVLVFRGFSSSLIRPTPDDPSDPVLPEGCQIVCIDRLQAPYKPSGDQVPIQEGLTVAEMMKIVEDCPRMR